MSFKKPLGVLRMKSNLSREQVARIREDWNGNMKGMPLCILDQANDSDLTIINGWQKGSLKIEKIINEDRSKNYVSSR